MLLNAKDIFRNFLTRTFEPSLECSGAAFLDLPIASTFISPQELLVNKNGPLEQSFSDFICIKIRIQMPWGS